MGKTKKPATKTVKPHLPAASLHSRTTRSVRLMQDVVKPARVAHKTASSQSSTASKTNTTVRAASSIDIKSGSHLKHHQPQTAHTLMRSAVSKPLPGLKRQLAAQSPADLNIKQGSFGIEPKWAVSQIDPRKIQHSKHVHKSKLIKRFASQPIVWYDAPSHADAAVRVQPEPTVSVSHNAKSMDIFQRAIEHATSHEQKPVNPRKQARADKRAAKHAKKPVHHRLPSVVATSLAVVLLAGFITYQNKTNITLRFADAKAGFHASLPSYKPSGFAIGNFRYGTGSVAVRYDRNGSGRTFTFSQQVSSLNSQTLLETTIAPHNSAYQTLSSGGRTIYIYGNNNAAWVDSGILYKITSEGNLSTSQILSVATSV